MDAPTSNNARRSSNGLSTSDEHAPVYYVKAEVTDDDEHVSDADSDHVVYKPRPQLPKPQVGLRSLAELISKRLKNICRVLYKC